jgi:2,3-diketo-5-methylthio-1-phosphopentane phosphatase
MPSIGSILIDFDGTACLHDVAEHLLTEFADESWPEYDEAWERGDLSGRSAIAAQAALLRATHEELVSYAMDHCPMDPTFVPFVEWCADEAIPTTLVSDGFGFYIRPLLESVGLADLPVVTNSWNGGGLTFDNGHPNCINCGTCKMQAVTSARERHGSVAFIGEGPSDRFGALYADIVFAKDSLTKWCEAVGVPFIEWEGFDDVRLALMSPSTVQDPVAPDPCPGWMDP